jgi:hypothetical protein
MDPKQFLLDFHDRMVPLLDVYEQSIYLYIIRMSRLIGQDDVVIGFKSARKQLAFGVGKANTPPSERICYDKVRSLESKGFVKVLGSEWKGMRISPLLPSEIPSLAPEDVIAQFVALEDMDFFENPENRMFIREREKNLCFYCQTQLNDSNYVIEHVVSRPEGNNSYSNLVAACRTCNNRKGDIDAKDFMRTLYREGVLSQEDLKDRMSHIELLLDGELKPNVANTYEAPVGQ